MCASKQNLGLYSYLANAGTIPLVNFKESRFLHLTAYWMTWQKSHLCFLSTVIGYFLPSNRTGAKGGCDQMIFFYQAAT